MKGLFIVLFFTVLALRLAGQKVFESYTDQQDSLKIGNGKNDFLPYGPKGYTLILPESNNDIRGVVISLDDERVNLQDTVELQMHHEAMAKELAVLYISTGIPVDLFFSNRSLKYVDAVTKNVFSKYKIPNKNIFFQGVMTSGLRALKYIEYCKKGKSIFKPDIKGVFLSESAIDWVRQWYEGQKQVRDHLTEVGFFEGNLVTFLFKQNLKDTPVTNIEKFLEFSPYSYFDRKMRHIPLFKDIAVRAYTFADVDYWFSAPGKGVYDSNYPDMSGIINELKLAGNKKAELIVFTKENKTNKMIPQSGTWGMVNKQELVDWIAKQTD